LRSRWAQAAGAAANNIPATNNPLRIRLKIKLRADIIWNPI
jgi:hypothetical protein